jgi:hypothetical protein
MVAVVLSGPNCNPPPPLYQLKIIKGTSKMLCSGMYLVQNFVAYLNFFVVSSILIMANKR